MAKKQYFGIKYPFRRDDFQHFYVDANNNTAEKVRSQLMHIVKTEVTESVNRWATNIKLNNIQVVKNEEDEHEIYVRLDYSVVEGNRVTNDSVVVQL